MLIARRSFFVKRLHDIFIGDLHSSIVNFIGEVKVPIENQCPIYLRQVEALTETFLCSVNSTVTPLPDYLDEDEDLNFFKTDQSLLNNTEQTVYVVCKYHRTCFREGHFSLER